MLPQKVIKFIAEVYGKPIRYPYDCDEISRAINLKTGKNISVNTMKRLLGFISEEREPRLYTLDIIAEYLGFDNWDVCQSQLSGRIGSSVGSFAAIKISKLKVDHLIKFRYFPDRMVVIKYCGDYFFDVIEAENSSLLIGDKIEVKQIVRNSPMYIDDVLRNGEHLGELTVGIVEGIRISHI